MSIPTNATVTVQRRSAGGVYTTFLSGQKAWIERTSYNEPRTDGATEAQDWLLLFPGTVSVIDGDRVLWAGETWEVANTPSPQQPPGGATHHTETRMRPGLPTLRTWFAETLVDTCRIERQGADTFDDATGEIVPGVRTVVYSGPCLVRPRDAYNRETMVVDNTTTLQSYNAFIPPTADTVEDDDVLIVTASEDTRLVNRELRITGVRMSSDVTGRVLSLEDILG